MPANVWKPLPFSQADRVDRGDHHLGGAVHCQQGPAVDLEQTVAVGDQFDLASRGSVPWIF